jgi:hypothetical protein
MTSPRLRIVHDRRDAADGDADGSDDDTNSHGGADGFGAYEFSEHEPTADSAHAAAAESEAAEARARRARALRLTLAGGVAFQALAVLHDAPRDWQYAATGAVAPPAVLAFPACLMLYVATALLARGRARGGTRVLFLVAAAAMAIAVPFWGLASPVTWPFELGGTLALAGAWLIHRDRDRALHLTGGTAHDGSLP